MKIVFAAIVCIGLGGFLFWFMGPAVLSDLTADKDQLQESAEYRIDKASCKTRVFIIGSCDVDVVNMISKEETSFDYLIFGRLGGESVYPLVQPNSGYVTTNIGIEYAFNRLIMLLLFGGGLLFGGLFVLYMAIFNPGRLNQAR